MILTEAWLVTAAVAFREKTRQKLTAALHILPAISLRTWFAAGLATKAEIQLAYAIGVAEPVSVRVDTFNTGQVRDAALCEAIEGYL